MDVLTILILLGSLVVFPLFWSMTVWLIAQFAWTALAQDWRTLESPSGTLHSGISARIQMTRYNGTLTAHFNESGLFLEPIWLFRVGHARLFIPWQDVTALHPRTILFYKGVQLELRNGKSIFFYGGFAQFLLSQFGQQ
jgi:hypothetical protein